MKKEPLNLNNLEKQNMASNEVVCLDKQCSTTKLCYKLLDDGYLDKNGRIRENLKFKINIPKFKIKNSKVTGKPEDKFETYLFLPPGEGRKGEGGLRTKGYFKFSYRKGVRGKGKGVSDGTKEWWIVDENDNFIEKVNLPETILQQLSTNNYKLTQLPLITVITVVLNGAKYLEETIQSVINQTYPNVEYIIIDGGSTDGTLDIIKKYEDKIDYWVSEKDKGIYDAMNKGIDLAGGKWINFMNAGDRFFNNRILSRVFFSKIINHDILYGDIIVNYYDFKKPVKAQPINAINRNMVFSHQSAFTKTIIHKNKKFNLNYKIAADYEFFYNLWKSNFEFLYIDDFVANVSIDGISNKKRLDVLWEYWKISGNKALFLRMMEESLKIFVKAFLPRQLIKTIIKLK